MLGDLDDEVVKILCRVLARAHSLDSNDIGPDTTLIELNVDSLTLMSVLSQVAAFFRVKLRQDAILACIRAEKICDLAREIQCGRAEVSPDWSSYSRRSS